MTAIEEDRERSGRRWRLPHFDRNGYFHAKSLTVRDFEAEQRYMNERRWFMNHTLLGDGVVCGLEVTTNGTSLCVGPGIAVDDRGREIVVPRVHTVTAEELRRHVGHREAEGAHSYELVVAVEFAECPWEPVTVPGICHGTRPHQEHNRIRDWYEVRLIGAEAGEGDRDGAHHRGACPLEHKELSVHEVLCRALRQCPEDREGHEHPALTGLVPLAEIVVRVDGDNIEVMVEDTCRVRRLVATNRLLFDLIDCYHGDLPHVRRISWVHGRRLAYWLLPPELRIDFDRLIDPDTLGDSTVRVSYSVLESESGSRSIRLVPFKIVTGRDLLTPGHAHSWATLQIDPDWYRDEIGSGDQAGSPRRSRIANTLRSGDEVMVEIVLRGAQIIGERDGKALDGDFIGGRLPSGNGTQGGDFVSHLWLVDDDDTLSDSDSYETDEERTSGDEES